MGLKLVNCDSPNCDKTFFVKNRKPGLHNFCKDCRQTHSLHVLEVQAEHGETIQQLILDATIMRNASGMADYLGISFVSIYNWIQKYFNMTFQEFRCEYICKTPACFKLSLETSSFVSQEALVNQLKQEGFCTCSNSLEKGVITTKAPMSVVSRILSERKKREPVHDPSICQNRNPLYFRTARPTYFTEKIDAL